jgi:hypothetical protein
MSCMPGARRGRLSLIRMLAVFLLAAMDVSCLLVDMGPLTVTSWCPHDALLLSGMSGAEIRIRFSRPVNMVLTEQAFSMTADDETLAGRISWADDRTLEFTPDEPLKDFVVYRMRVSGQAEDAEGRDLSPEFAHAFTTKTDSSRPTVTSTSPADHQSIADVLAPLTITFSEPMDPATLCAAFALAPAASGFLAVSPDGTVLTFTPSQRLQWQTRYTITVAQNAADLQRNTLGSDHISHFFVGTDLSPPAVISLHSADASLDLVEDDPMDSVITVTPGWEATQGLVVTFSEPVLTAGASLAVRISPAVEYTIEETRSDYASTLTYRFPNRLVYGVTYTVSVMPGVQDAQGNRSTGEAAYHFLVDGPETAPPVVTRIAFPTGTADPANNAVLAPDCPIPLPPVAAGEVETFFDLYIDLAQGATLDPFAVGRAFSVSTTNNAARISSFAVQIGPTVTNPGPNAAANEVVARVWVHIVNYASSGQVVIHVSTDLMDARGAALVREHVLPLNDPD